MGEPACLKCPEARSVPVSTFYSSGVCAAEAEEMVQKHPSGPFTFSPHFRRDGEGNHLKQLSGKATS